MNATITITLPADRRMPGRLLYRSAEGDVLFSCPALGRSAGHATNLARDPLKYRGDTPLGQYALTFVTGLAKPITGIGSLWIGLDPEDAVDSQARRAERAGRRGLGIHGGRGDRVLKVTHGCVRLRDCDMAALAKTAGKTRFTVLIEAEAA